MDSRYVRRGLVESIIFASTDIVPLPRVSSLKQVKSGLEVPSIPTFGYPVIDRSRKFVNIVFDTNW